MQGVAEWGDDRHKSETMNEAIMKLASIGSGPLGEPFDSPAVAGATPISMAELERCGLAELLRQKNGFYAFEGALHVLPALRAPGEYGLKEWNSRDLWRACYQELAQGCFFFAEDIFGGQFCLCDGSIMSFDPETGPKEIVGLNIDEWARSMLENYDLLSGHRLVHEWQAQHGALPSGYRLVPKTPFVLGGDFAIDNLFPLDVVRAMRSRANLAIQIKCLPDGSRVEYKIVD